ncbi:keratin-associated protein 19-2-like [Amphibalanus amphitrite]|uniref:keratin-associated protein 19-2-like n=1 Tax=Amphibalanus amphitrite TaxID=1232801 RepID=UPI001C902074|nr:keratin-associated protein 19-2-like [Amphibalanus amphitrite]
MKTISALLAVCVLFAAVSCTVATKGKGGGGGGYQSVHVVHVPVIHRYVPVPVYHGYGGYGKGHAVGYGGGFGKGGGFGHGGGFGKGGGFGHGGGFGYGPAPIPYGGYY